MHPEDQKIVDTARDLCQQLGYNIVPQTVSWRDRMGIRKVPPDFFLVFPNGIFAGSILLSKSAMGKLTPEEWKPFIASGLIFYKNRTRENLRGMIPMMIIMLAILVFSLVFSPVLVFSFRFLDNIAGLSLLSRIIAELIVVIALMGAVVWGMLHFILNQKRLWFKADEQAANLTGKEALASSLRKLGLIEPSASTGRRGFIRPSIDERIDHLMNAAGPR